MDLDQDERRGIDAQQVLDSKIYQEAFRTIEERLLAQFATIEITKERAEYLRQLLTMGRKYKSYLEQVMVTGKMAEEQKSLMQRMKESVKSYY